jgi:hypothetical protein
LAGGDTATSVSGLWHSTDSGASFTKVSNVTEAVNVGFGKAAPGQSYQALFLMGTVDGVKGVYRSDNAAAGWVRINDNAHQYGNAGEALTGDPRIYGRVYLGTNGRGVLYADRTGTTTTPPADTTVPSTPGTPSASAVTSSGASLTWTASTDNVGVVGYNVYRRVGSTDTQIATSTSSSVALTGLTASTAYSVVVRARDAAGNLSATSAAGSFTTLSSGGGGSGCSAAYSITGSWSGGFQGSVVVTNTGTTATTGWTVTWTFANGQTISQIWGGVLTASGSSVSVKNETYNATLAPSATTTFGFLASWNGTNSVPTTSCTRTP